MHTERIKTYEANRKIYKSQLEHKPVSPTRYEIRTAEVVFVTWYTGVFNHSSLSGTNRQVSDRFRSLLRY